MANTWTKFGDEWQAALESPFWDEEEVDGDLYVRLLMLLATVSDRIHWHFGGGEPNMLVIPVRDGNAQHE